MRPETADLLLGVCVKRSFDRATVDGQLSTNDTAILMCSGASGVASWPESEDELRFGEALDALLRQLAIMMVADGEGAGRIARVVVRGGQLQSAEAAARAVANSPLVKTALHGADPNWGRIVQAVGGALPGTAPLAARRLDRGDPRLRRRCGDLLRRDRPSRTRFARRRSNTRSPCPARAPRPRCSSRISRTSTCTLNAEYTT